MVRDLGKAVWGAQTREDMIQELSKGWGVLREWVNSHGSRSFAAGFLLGLLFLALFRLIVLAVIVVGAVGVGRYVTKPHRTVVPT